MSFNELKQKDILPLKIKLHKQNNGICPLLGVAVDISNMTLDQIHKLNSEDYAPDKGTIRNAIEFRANALEGKITNNWKRYYGADESRHPVDLPTYLRNLAGYLEAGALNDDGVYHIHPSEVKKLPRLTKQCYNRLKKAYDARAKFPEYPKSKKLTKNLALLFEKYNIDIVYYK